MSVNETLFTTMSTNETFSSCVTAVSTLILMIITGCYAIITNKMVKISKNSQETEYIQRRLEKLYYPLKITLNSYEMSKENLMSQTYISKIKNDMREIMPYLYLSSG